MDFKGTLCGLTYNLIIKKITSKKTGIGNSTQFSLTPSTINKEIENKPNKAYQPVKDIASKLLDIEVKNIALTGAYGSGKSSILQTLQEDFPQYNYLNISLATLDCEGTKRINIPHTVTPEENEDLNFKNKSAYNGNDALNRLIEYSILQQLVYREKIEQLPQSRFKRIKHISPGKGLKYSVGIILFVLAGCILFEPHLLRVQSLYDLFSAGEKWKTIWDFICLIYIVVFSIYSMKWLIVNTYNRRLNKLNLVDGEIDIAESTSIFNKHLDEIIYYFEVTQYDVVILEDLDRFETHDIFLKLRELNNLLNNSNAIHRANNRPIVFIYAVRDNIFKNTSRTKFFDYITTVVPVINPSNSCNMLLKALEANGITNITDDTCIDLGIYIDDMRILKNIVNEYVQY